MTSRRIFIIIAASSFFVLLLGTIWHISDYRLDLLPVPWKPSHSNSPNANKPGYKQGLANPPDSDLSQGPSDVAVAPSGGLNPTGERYPVSSYIPLPTGKPAKVSKIQYEFEPETPKARARRESRLAAVKRAISHTSQGYMTHAWRKDEVAPVTGGYRTSLAGWGVTLIDSLDLLWLSGAKDDFEFAVNAVVEIDFTQPDSYPINVFETTIRYLGGLLGAYDISDGKYPVLLEKARELGDFLYEAFDTPNRMPVLLWRRLGVEVASSQTRLAELGSMTLEFTRLSVLTGNPKYYDAVQRIMNNFQQAQNTTQFPGLWPTVVNAREFDASQAYTFTLSGASDSMYEYLPKTYQLLQGRVHAYKDMYRGAIKPVKQHMFFQPMTPEESDILLSGDIKKWGAGPIELDPQMNHLTCFAGGMLALSAKVFDRPADIETARQLVDGCIWAYKSTATGIMPETFHAIPCGHPFEGLCTWDENAWFAGMLKLNSYDEKPGDKDLPRQERIDAKAARLRLPKGISAIANRRYLLRPEAIESIFVLYRITGEGRFMDEAWSMFQAITNQTRTPIAFSSIDDVTSRDPTKLDRMESYWMAETLKYFLLVFSETDVASLDEFVFNTEGHPLRVGVDAGKKEAEEVGDLGMSKAVPSKMPSTNVARVSATATATATLKKAAAAVDDHGYGIHQHHGSRFKIDHGGQHGP